VSNDEAPPALGGEVGGDGGGDVGLSGASFEVVLTSLVLPMLFPLRRRSILPLSPGATLGGLFTR